MSIALRDSACVLSVSALRWATCSSVSLSNHTSLPQQELALYSYSVIGLFISSILLMSRYSSSLITSGVFCLFLTIIYGIDVYFSYTGLVNRSSSSSNTESASPAAPSAQHPAVISGHNSAVYPSMAPPTLTGVDEVDLRDDIDTEHQGGVSHTNPIYPTTLNYPPFPLPDTTSLPHFPGGSPAP